MALPNPFVVPNAQQSPYLRDIAGVGGAYDTLRAGAQPQLTGASSNLISAGQGQIGPSEFDPGVAGLLETARNPVNNALEDYYRQKFMADVGSRVAMHGGMGQGWGEGVMNDAERGFLANRMDSANQRSINAIGAANQVRTGQVGRAASLTGAGLSPYDTLSKMLSGSGNAYATAGELGNQVGIANARNRTSLTPSYLNAYGQLANTGLGAAKGAYDFFNAPGTDAQIANTRDYGLTSEQPSWSASGSDSGGGGGDSVDITGGYLADGGRVRGEGAYDHVRAMLTPQEFVVRRPVAMKALPALKELNEGDYDQAVRKLAQVARVAR